MLSECLLVGGGGWLKEKSSEINLFPMPLNWAKLGLWASGFGEKSSPSKEDGEGGGTKKWGEASTDVEQMALLRSAGSENLPARHPGPGTEVMPVFPW